MPNAREASGLIDPAQVGRFGADLARLLPDERIRVGLAVSGGTDSLAMLLLAAALGPERFEVASVDHGLRAEAVDEAALVARHCAVLGLRHTTLAVEVPHEASIQAAARKARYQALRLWCEEQGLGALLTAHHADDQAETLLMRLARGAGQGGLAGIREVRDLDGVTLARPLLGWRRAELGALVATLDGVAQDPSNADDRYDRVRMRQWLATTDLLDPLRLQATAHHLGEAEEALDWMTEQAIRSRCTARTDGTIEADLEGLPRELHRRILSSLIARADSPADGPALQGVMDRIDRDQKASIGALTIVPGRRIRIEKAPERR